MKIKNFKIAVYSEVYSKNEIGDMTVCDPDGNCLVGAFRCKDFLQDIVCGQWFKKDTSIYGFRWTYLPNNPQLYIVYTAEAVKCNIQDNYDNIKNFILHFVPDAIVYFDANFIVVTSQKCFSKLYLVSFLSSIIRLAVHATDDIEEYIKILLEKNMYKTLHGNDLNTFKYFYPFIDSIYDLEDLEVDAKTSISVIHNDTGVRSIISSQKQKKCQSL